MQRIERRIAALETKLCATNASLKVVIARVGAGFANARYDHLQ